MLISEVLSGDATDEAAAPLRRIERLVSELEHASPMLAAEMVDNLREAVLGLKPELSEDQKLQVWKAGYRIWNTCVDMANHLQQQGGADSEDHVRLRQVASDMLLIAGIVKSIASSALKMAMFFFKTGTSWQKLGNPKLASGCFEKATEVLSKSEDNAGKEEQQFIFDLSLARSKAAWDLSQRTLASSLLGRARGLLMGNTERHQELVLAYLQFGKALLANDDAESKAESVKFIEQSFEICCEALKVCTDPADARALTALKFTILRYIAAGQLQNGNYEGVLKCVSALKGVSDHPSTPFLAFKALVNMNRHEEAEKELLALVCHDKATVDVCVSALGFVIDECRQLDVAKKAFFILQSRFPSNNELSVKVVEKLLKQAAPSDPAAGGRVEMALSVATDEKTLKGFKAVGNRLHSPVLLCQKEQQCMHALLWNSGSDFFQAKDYRIAIKLFEAAMLYLPLGEEIPMRGKALRVLCLCHLGLPQYDRAAEYIDAAEKLEPNIACSFLKFKVCLQMKDEAGAANEIVKMTKCPDFDTEYLTLASHEALACKSTKVAVTAMSSMLGLPSSGSSSISEVVIFRNLIDQAMKDPGCNQDAVAYLLRARDRLCKAGAEVFFGPGTTGHKEANWFAGCAWNLGLAASKSEDWKRCGELFSTASEFYVLLPESEEKLQQLQSALLLSVAALLRASKENDPEELKLASVHLEKCRKVHEMLLSKSDAYASASFHLNILAFDLKGRMKEYKEQLEIMYRCASLPGFKPEYLFGMGMMASGSENVDVPIAVFRSCLNLLLSSGAPDYKKAAIIVRKLVVLSDQRNKDGPEVMKLYKEANHMLVGLGNEEYPCEEVQWLVSTAWNRAALQMKLSRVSAAEQWMKVALDLLKHAPPRMDVYRAGMVDSFNELLKQKTNSMEE